jgi:transposase-like protein
MEELNAVITYPEDVSDPEVSAKAVRRKLTAAYKVRILREADRCTEPGQLGALLRREGLYSSNLTRWRRQMVQGLISNKRGPVARNSDPNIRRISELEKEIVRLKSRLKKADLIIDVQKKMAELLNGSTEVKS